MSIQLFQGDCLDILQQFESDSVDLVYLDPPFFTQKIHKLRARSHEGEYFFSDVWESHSEYIEFIRERLKQVWRVLKSTGSVFFHCDRNAAHIIRLLLDDVFGARMFRSEIVWSYRRWSNSRKGLLPSHQLIYYYTKSKDYVFNPIYGDYSPTTNVDQILQRRRRDKSGKTIYERNSNGEIVPGGGKKGVPLRDVWDDIPYLNPKARERVGYPTQKPISLLERIIRIATNEGDTVLDPFCGSGTTLVAAMRLERKAIGIDVSKDAIEISRSRLQHPVLSTSDVLKNGRNSFKKSNDELLALLSGINYAAVQRNQGIDAILEDDLCGKPILVRIQRQTETILDAANKLYKASKGKNAAALIVIATRSGGYFDVGNQLPDEIMVVKSPALAIREILEQLSVIVSVQT